MKLASAAHFDDAINDQAAALAPLRDVEFIEMPARTVLNRCENPRLPFRWTINPYRGCEFGCVYCYARYTHEFLELRDPMDFERRVFVKREAALVLARTLFRTPVGSDQIAIGTATDPYQPAERRLSLTRRCLEVFAEFRNPVAVVTKNHLVTRDSDLLAALAGGFPSDELEEKFDLTALQLPKALPVSLPSKFVEQRPDGGRRVQPGTDPDTGSAPPGLAVTRDAVSSPDREPFPPGPPGEGIP